MSTKTCTECGGTNIGDYADQCVDCCPHDDIDDGYCLICGADRTEALAARAYDMAKDARYYVH